MTPFKMLKSTTIVPEELYVDRSADRQVLSVLSDMGRPGYVLVSRQMGKTNLLLNTKKRNEDADNIFVYVDLSNLFKTSRECFRNIIDVALEANEDVFKEIHRIIFEKRRDLELPPHKEHQYELKLLLKQITGKLVIILDEVDALASCSYSDEIFSQIRSVYFNRVNFKESERLTYLLSGVAEPSELIKNKDISPFNIGHKIYLEDFTRDEFKIFVDKANLYIDQVVFDQIYNWTSGNPRMVWDICSEIEEIIKICGSVNVDDVDLIVQKFYFENYKKAPIDHIREKVESSKELRDAIIQIKYGNGSSISDKLKIKLYLSGIINSFSSTKIVEIKNKIVDECLSESWLNSLEIKDKGLFRSANDKFLDKRYSEAIELFSECLKSGCSDDSKELTASERSYISLRLGQSHYYKGDLKEALEFLGDVNFDKNKHSEQYYSSLLAIASSHYGLNEISLSMKSYELVLEDKKQDNYYLQALLGLGTIFSLKDDNGDFDKARSLFSEALNVADDIKEELGENGYRDFKTSALYSIGLLESELTPGKVSLSLEDSLCYALTFQKPSILNELSKSTNDNIIKIKFINDAVDIIIDNNLKPNTNRNLYIIDFNFNVLYNIFYNSYLIDREGAFNRLYDYVKSVICGIDIQWYDLLFYLSSYCISRGENSAGRDILVKIHEDSKLSSVPENLQYNCYKYLCSIFFDSLDSNNDYFSRYIILFKSQDKYSQIDAHDIISLSNGSLDLLKNNKINLLTEIFDIVNPFFENSIDKIKLDLSILKFIEIRYLELNNNFEDYILKSQIFLDNLNYFASKNIISSIVTKQDTDYIKSYLENLLRENKVLDITSHTPFVRSMAKIPVNQKVNVKYKDGTEKIDKYKRVKTDIDTGNCVIIN